MAVHPGTDIERGQAVSEQSESDAAFSKSHDRQLFWDRLEFQLLLRFPRPAASGASSDRTSDGVANGKQQPARLSDADEKRELEQRLMAYCLQMKTTPDATAATPVPASPADVEASIVLVNFPPLPLADLPTKEGCVVISASPRCVCRRVKLQSHCPDVRCTLVLFSHRSVSQRTGGYSSGTTPSRASPSLSRQQPSAAAAVRRIAEDSPTSRQAGGKRSGEEPRTQGERCVLVLYLSPSLSNPVKLLCILPSLPMLRQAATAATPSSSMAPIEQVDISFGRQDPFL